MRFKLHQIKAYLNNIYIAEYDHGLLMLDSGSSSDYDLIRDYIRKEIRRDINDVKLIVVSHIHPDHSGTARRFNREYNIPIAAHENINLWYSGIPGFIQHRFDNRMALYNSRKNGLPKRNFSFPRKLDLSYELHHFNKLPIFNDWVVYHVPGHTNHDIVLYNDFEKILYCSDTVVMRNRTILPPFPVTDVISINKTYDLLGSLECKSYLLAHGGVISDSECDENIYSHAKRNLCRPMKGILKYFYPFFFITSQAEYKNSCNSERKDSFFIF